VKIRLRLALLAIAISSLAACATSTSSPSTSPTDTSLASSHPSSITEGRTTDMPMTLTAADFQDGGDIPTEHTCDAANTPISLSWTGVPDETAELALVMDDPDARGFVHWVVVGIPSDADGLPGGQLPSGASAGQAGFGRAAYGGPCPPSGTHRYEFRLYALSAPLGAGASPTAEQVRSAAADKTIETALLTGRYSRQR
jgi:Raf kinase inhibitor-like YbhB/YbcL family protein